MKIAVIDYYGADSSPHKDPISIPRGLAALGHEIELVTRKCFGEKSLFGFKTSELSDWLAHDLEHNRPDAVIAISRFDPALTSALRKIKSREIPLVVKGDTDGSIGYPIPPHYLRSRPLFANPLNVFRHLKWRAPISYFVKQRIEHIQLADLVVCESPGAASNLSFVLNYWGLANQVEKIVLIPNAISKIYTEARLVGKTASTVVSVGRWDDKWCKGADLLADSISYVLSRQPNMQFIIVGNNPEYVEQRVPKNFRGQVWFTGPKDFVETQSLVASAQILLVPSRLESFSLVSGEALCTGASLVVTPVESLIYLAGGGAYGSIARDFSVQAIGSAVLHELRAWKGQYRNVDAIASHWRTILSEDRISLIWLKELERLFAV